MDFFNFGNFILPYDQFVYLAIGIGMLVGLLFSESLGVMGGGVIVPGYFALYLQNPVQIITTFLIGIVTYYIVYFMSKYW